MAFITSDVHDKIHDSLDCEEFHDSRLCEESISDTIFDYSRIMCNTIYDIIYSGLRTRSANKASIQNPFQGQIIKSPYYSWYFESTRMKECNDFITQLDASNAWTYLENSVIFQTPITHLNRAKFGNITFENSLFEPLSESFGDESIYHAFTYYMGLVFSWTCMHGVKDTKQEAVYAHDYKIIFMDAMYFSIVKALLEELKAHSMTWASEDFVDKHIEEVIIRKIWNPIREEGHMKHIYPEPANIREIINYYMEGCDVYGDLFYD